MGMQQWNIEIVGSQGDPRFQEPVPRQFHSSYEAELVLFSLVKNGSVEALHKMLSSSPLGAKPVRVGRMSYDDVRQAQYLAVAFATLATRSAIEGGLREAIAYEMSDAFIQRIDKERSADEILQSCAPMFLSLAEAVQKAQPATAYSLPIKRCIEFIHSHFAQGVPLAALAAHCGLSKGYLCSLFKKEVGSTISQYVLDKKLEEAKSMLLGTSYAYDEISASLNFCSQSYFIQRFRQKYGMTPKAYRLHHTAPSA